MPGVHIFFALFFLGCVAWDGVWLQCCTSLLNCRDSAPIRIGECSTTIDLRSNQSSSSILVSCSLGSCCKDRSRRPLGSVLRPERRHPRCDLSWFCSDERVHRPNSLYFGFSLRYYLLSGGNSFDSCFTVAYLYRLFGCFSHGGLLVKPVRRLSDEHSWMATSSQRTKMVADQAHILRWCWHITSFGWRCSNVKEFWIFYWILFRLIGSVGRLVIAVEEVAILLF